MTTLLYGCDSDRTDAPSALDGTAHVKRWTLISALLIVTAFSTAGCNTSKSTGTAPLQKYGAPLHAAMFSNATIGPYGQQVSIRFRAQHTGPIDQVLLYVPTEHKLVKKEGLTSPPSELAELKGSRPCDDFASALSQLAQKGITEDGGYGNGTGGKLSLQIMTSDKNGDPATVIGANTPLDMRRPDFDCCYYPYLDDEGFAYAPNPRRTSHALRVVLNKHVSLVAGELYHLVVSNADGNATGNYFSIESLLFDAGLPAQPVSDELDLAFLGRAGSGPWKLLPGRTPIYSIHYDVPDPQTLRYLVQGQGYVAAHMTQLSAGTILRECFMFKPNSTVITAVHCFARWDGADPTAPLEVSIYAAATSSPLTTGTALGAEWAKLNSVKSANGFAWVSIPVNVALDSNKNYLLHITASKGGFSVPLLMKGSKDPTNNDCVCATSCPENVLCGFLDDERDPGNHVDPNQFKGLSRGHAGTFADGHAEVVSNPLAPCGGWSCEDLPFYFELPI